MEVWIPQARQYRLVGRIDDRRPRRLRMVAVRRNLGDSVALYDDVDVVLEHRIEPGPERTRLDNRPALRRRRSVGQVERDLLLPRSVRLDLLELARRHIEDGLRVGLPRDHVRNIIGNLHGRTRRRAIPVGGHHLEHGVADERDLRAVRRIHRRAFRAVGDRRRRGTDGVPRRRLARDVDDAQLVVALAEARVHAVVIGHNDLGAVARPGRPADLRLRRQLGHERRACARRDVHYFGQSRPRRISEPILGP